MKVITKKQLTKRRISAFCGFIVMLCISLFIIFLPDISETPIYDNLFVEEDVVSDVERVYNRGGYSYHLFTSNKHYLISGDFDYDTLVNVLTEGTEITIKWQKHPLFIFPDGAYEVIVGEEVVVAYDNSPTPRGIFLVLGIVIIVISAIGLSISLWYINHLKTLQEKRDKRICKKYGDKAK